jgi:hypothetical protein
MLNFIDNLPLNSKTSEAMSLDREHQQLIRETLAASGQELPKYSPPMSQWSMEASLLAQVVDAVNVLRHIVIVTSGDGKNKPKPPEPIARPRTVNERVEFEARRAAHEALADKLLSRRGKVQYVPPEQRQAAPESAVERITGVQQNAPVNGTMSDDAAT